MCRERSRLSPQSRGVVRLIHVSAMPYPGSLWQTKKSRPEGRLFDAAAAAYFSWLLISLVMSNIDTWAFLKTSFSLASALIIRLFIAS